MFNVYIKTLRDKRFFILGWAVGLLFLGYLMTSFFPSFSGGQVDGLLEAIPPALQGLVGDLQDWNHLPSYIGSQIYDIRLPIFISILSILLAVGLTVGEEERGQLRTLVSLPVSRRRIVMGKWFAAVTICFIASLAPVAGIGLGLLQIQESVDPMVLVRLTLFTWLMVTAVAMVIIAIGLATGKRALTTGFAIIVTIGSFLLSTFAMAVDWLEPYEKLSFFHYFPAVDIAEGTIDWWNAAFYMICLVVALVVTLLVFPRRDIKE